MVTVFSWFVVINMLDKNGIRIDLRMGIMSAYGYVGDCPWQGTQVSSRRSNPMTVMERT